jgi:hypothetical protein
MARGTSTIAPHRPKEEHAVGQAHGADAAAPAVATSPPALAARLWNERHETPAMRTRVAWNVAGLVALLVLLAVTQ